MDGLLLTARCLLAVVFLIAAGGKLLDLHGARQALTEFGVPARVARLGGPALPVAELVVVVALVIRPSAVWGAVGGLVLLLGFTGGVARAMSQGRSPDCHCFGQIHSEPAGPLTLVRNLGLGAVAVVVIAGAGGPSIDAGLSGLDGTQVALVAIAALAAFLAVTVVQRWSDKRRSQRQVTAIAAKAPPGLPRGAPAPDFALTAVRGNAVSLGDLALPGRPTVLVFVSTGCGPCLQMLPTLARWQDSLSDSLSLPAIFAGERGEIVRISEEQGLTTALAQDANEAFELYALRTFPCGVLVDTDGVIAGAPAEGVPAIEALIRSALARTEANAGAIHRG